jgi:hypothetical protein
MNKQLILDKLVLLPEEVQVQVVDYIDFLLNKYKKSSQNNLTEKNIKENEEELSPELKQFLNKRLENYRQNPHNVKTWEEVEEQFEKKYGHEI